MDDVDQTIIIYYLLALKWIQPLFMHVATTMVTFQGALNEITDNSNNKNTQKNTVLYISEVIANNYNVDGYKVLCIYSLFGIVRFDFTCFFLLFLHIFCSSFEIQNKPAAMVFLVYQAMIVLFPTKHIVLKTMQFHSNFSSSVFCWCQSENYLSCVY